MTRKALKGKKIAITSGPTRAPIDAVRFISNRSTGALGVAIAEQCLREGARVNFFHGVGSLLPRRRAGLGIIEIETVGDLVKALKKKLPGGRYDAFFHAMAVLDYIPRKATKGKIRSGKESLILRLVKTPKAINLIKQLSPETTLIGFKLRVGATKARLLETAKRLRKSSKADFVLANDLRTVERGRHVAYVLDEEGNFRGPLKGKKNIAKALVNMVSSKIR